MNLHLDRVAHTKRLGDGSPQGRNVDAARERQGADSAVDRELISGAQSYIATAVLPTAPSAAAPASTPQGSITERLAGAAASLFAG